VAIHKPGRDDFVQLKADCSSSLMSCMGNVVHTVVAEQLSDEGEKRELMSNRQFGSRIRWSAIDAAAIIVAREHAALKDGHIAGMLLMDIKAAFSSMAKGRLVNLMRVRQMDGDLIRWKECILLERKVEMVIEHPAMKRHPVQAGDPQRSPVLPILFAIYPSGLIIWVEEYVSAKGLCFVDNLGWVATGSDVYQVVTILESCAVKSIEWASRRGLQFDTAKKEAVQFTRRCGHKTHLRAKVTAKIRVEEGFIRFNRQATR
jgi:hypothetical protein